MAVLDQHTVKDDPTVSRDWTAIGARILEAATIATAIHLQEVTHAECWRDAASGRTPASGGWNREVSDENG